MSRSAAGRVLLEIVAVVGGILIAFALDAWWDARAVVVWEVSQLEALHAEFSENVGHLNEVIRDHEAMAGHLVEIVDFAGNGPESARSVFADTAAG